MAKKKQASVNEYGLTDAELKFIETACDHGKDSRGWLSVGHVIDGIAVSADGYRLHVIENVSADDAIIEFKKSHDAKPFINWSGHKTAIYESARSGNAIHVRADALRSAVKRALVFAKDSNNSVRFGFHPFNDPEYPTMGEIVVEGRSLEKGDCSTIIDARYAASLDPVWAAYNGVFILDALKLADDDTVITIHYRDHDEAIAIVYGRYAAVIQPMSIDHMIERHAFTDNTVYQSTRADIQKTESPETATNPCDLEWRSKIDYGYDKPMNPRKRQSKSSKRESADNQYTETESGARFLVNTYDGWTQTDMAEINYASMTRELNTLNESAKILCNGVLRTYRAHSATYYTWYSADMIYVGKLVSNGQTSEIALIRTMRPTSAQRRAIIDFIRSKTSRAIVPIESAQTITESAFTRIPNPPAIRIREIGGCAIVSGNGQRFAIVPVPHGIAVYDANRREIVASRNHGTTVNDYLTDVKTALSERGFTVTA